MNGLVQSISAKLALMFGLLVLLAFGLTGWAMFARLAAELSHEQVHAQQAKLNAALALLERGRAGGPVSAQWPRIALEIQSLQRSDRATRYWVFCSEGPGTVCSPDRPALSNLQRNASGHRVQFAAAGLQPLSARSGPTLWALSDDLAGLPAGHRVRLVVTRDDAAMRLSLQRFFWQAAALSLTAAGVTGLLGWGLARRALKPVRDLSAAAAGLGPDQLARRMPVPPLGSELHGLTLAFNAALARIEAAFEQLQTFNADVAHELRTPLNTLIGSTQVALAKHRSADELREVLTGNLEDCERLATLVRDMLFLARADHGQRAASRRPTALHDLARDTAEFFEPLLEEQGLRLTIRGEATAHVDAGLVKRALSNLLANAVQYGQPGEPIAIDLLQQVPQGQAGGPRGSGCELVVSNRGPALPPEQLARLFDRFYRADPARHHSGGHAGLGLAIVRAVAVMHDGTVFARCEGGRVHVGLRLP